MEVITNNKTFFNELYRNVKNENKANNTRIPSVANTYQNEPRFQQAENLSRVYARKGQQKFADPFPIKSRPYDNYYNGRNLHILQTLQINATKDFPDVITKHPLKVVGYY